MTTRSKTVSMISFIREKFVQNMVRVVEYVREEVVVHVSNQLRWRGIIDGVQAKRNSTSDRCFETLLIGRAGKTSPCRRCIQQFGEHDGLVDEPQ